MSEPWTPDRVLALAPDPAGAAAGRELAESARWESLGADEHTIWGTCRGSSRAPYRTVVAPAEPAFHCTCPSRKRPCKHALALLLLHAHRTAAFTRGNAPDWVATWLEGRARRAPGPAAPAAAPAPANAEARARARRAAAREQRVRAGIDDLAVWLRDLARAGLAAAQSRPAAAWAATAARLVDAQAPGLARHIHELRAVTRGGDGWADRATDRLGRLHLLVEAYRHETALSDDERDELRAALGWTTDAADLARRDAVRDHWITLGSITEIDDRLRSRRTWLLGRDTARPAVIVEHAFGKQPLPPALPAGRSVHADLAFYPGSVPMRAAIRTTLEDPVAAAAPGAAPGVPAALETFARAVAAAPWLERALLVARDVRVTRDRERWTLTGADGRALPIHPAFPHGWTLLAFTGGHPSSVHGEWNGEHLRPTSAFANDEWLDLSAEPA